jgi:hypothetical protein
VRGPTYGRLGILAALLIAALAVLSSLGDPPADEPASPGGPPVPGTRSPPAAPPVVPGVIPATLPGEVGGTEASPPGVAGGKNGPRKDVGLPRDVTVIPEDLLPHGPGWTELFFAAGTEKRIRV